MAPTDTQFDNLKKRVKALEVASSPAALPVSWIQRHQVLTWLLSLTVTVLAIIIAIYTGVIPHIEKDDGQQITIQVSNGLRDPLQNIGKMSEEIAEINGTLKAWAPFMTPQFFKKTASLPDKQFSASLPQITAVTHIASDSKAEIPVEDIANIGKRTIKLSSGNSDSANLAWQATTALLQYRSVLNNIAPPASVTAPTFGYTTHYHWNVPPGTTQPTLRSTSPVPKEHSAAADFIGHDENQDQPTGPGALVFEGGGFVLDNMHLKNVVFINVHVSYHGGPINLENVSFLNCTFDITPDSNGRQLAEVILLNPATTISAS